MKSIRKVLGQALINACEAARELTGKSINAVPEYFLVVKSAEFIHKHFKTFTFSMEDSLVDLCKRAEIAHEKINKICRIGGNARADLVLMNKSGKKVRHVVEFKRGLHVGQIKKDALRLAGLCAHAPAGHRMEKNFLVVVSAYGAKVLEKRTEDIKGWIGTDFPNVEVKFEAVDIGEYESSRKASEGKMLHGGVWEFSYRY